MKTSYGKPTFNSRATTFHQNLINKNDKKNFVANTFSAAN